MALPLSIIQFLGTSSSVGLSAFGSLRPSDLGKLSSRTLEFTHAQSHLQKLEIKEVIGSAFGTYFRVTTYGECHVGGVGCVIDGCPPQILLSEADIQLDLNRRRPGQSRVTTLRKETDACQIYSGIVEGVTTGSPIMDYSEMSIKYRPSHADATYDFKYGLRSVQGGGRSSARETVGRVAAGAVAKNSQTIFRNRGSCLCFSSPQCCTSKGFC